MLGFVLSLAAVCASQPLPEPAREGFRHLRSRLAAKAGADHVALDALVPLGIPGQLRAKLRYGPMGKDLEREDVRAWLDDCKRLVSLGRSRTDGEGWVALPLPRIAEGRYRLVIEVAGDGTRAQSTLRVLPRRASLAIFDVDGTLTLADPELASDALRDRKRPWAGRLAEATDRWMQARAYPAACELTRTMADRGHAVVYLTGRPTLLAHVTRRWLEQQGCAPGHVILAEQKRHILPHEASVGAHKRAALAALAAHGFAFAYAFGNASTDVSAYAAAGIPADRTYIIGEHAGEGGTRAVKDGWTDVVRELAK